MNLEIMMMIMTMRRVTIMSKKPMKILFEVNGFKKCLIAYSGETISGVSTAVCDLENPDDDNIELAKIQRQWCTLHFCNKNALHKFVSFFQEVEEQWDNLSDWNSNKTENLEEKRKEV